MRKTNQQMVQKLSGRIAAKLEEAARELRNATQQLDFADVVPWTYNPLEYAWQAHVQYLQKYGNSSNCRVLFLGMNPGPWGMTQTGIPFGEVSSVRDWLEIDAAIGRPERQHPKRPIEGLQCQRSEVSGRRLWGLFRDRFGTPQEFFREHFVANYCPLVFMEESAKNITPDKLPAETLRELELLCDQHLSAVIKGLDVDWVIGVGAFAEKCAQRVASDARQIGKILHPSPASPAANRDWAGLATSELVKLGIWSL